MISRVKIENYKSIESAEFEARRVNVFIGEPNSGKSNLLEAISLTNPRIVKCLDPAIRMGQVADLFYDLDATRTVSVVLSPGHIFKLGVRGDAYFAAIEAPPVDGTDRPQSVDFLISPDARTITPAGKQFEGAVRYYRYLPGTVMSRNRPTTPTLSVPFGDNIVGLLAIHQPLRESVAALFQSKGFRLEIRPAESRISMTKDVDGVLYSFPFESISETMRRIVFYKAALESNKDAILVFDEPESNTFPFYTKYLAERIALDESNQFFLTTHNPYVLMSIIEKTPSVDLAVYVTRMNNYRTEIRLLERTDLEQALDLGMDFFFNLRQFFPE